MHLDLHLAVADRDGFRDISEMLARDHPVPLPGWSALGGIDPGRTDGFARRGLEHAAVGRFVASRPSQSAHFHPSAQGPHDRGCHIGRVSLRQIRLRPSETSDGNNLAPTAAPKDAKATHAANVTRAGFSLSVHTFWGEAHMRLSKKNSAVLAIAVAALLLSGCSAPEASEPKPETTTAVSSDATEEAGTAGEASFADNVLSLPEYTIRITDSKMIAVGQPGNEYGEKPVIAFWYEVTNNSDETTDPTTAWIGTFTAIQDNDPNAVNELNVGMLPDAQFGDSQLQDIKKGGTVANAVAYELDDETTPVELLASNDLGMTEIGRATFTLQ